FGRQVDSFEATVDDDGVGAVEGVVIPAPGAESAGPGATVLARRDGKIVVVRQGPLLATAFHPELTGDPRIHQYFVAMIQDG
ncbi:MAG: pyridoxal 5'-phosphate synthase glutaminase subunit PdxT, partial [Mycobacteriales bacterium]